jgi:hypothetical protein
VVLDSRGILTPMLRLRGSTGPDALQRAHERQLTQINIHGRRDAQDVAVESAFAEQDAVLAGGFQHLVRRQQELRPTPMQIGPAHPRPQQSLAKNDGLP